MWGVHTHSTAQHRMIDVIDTVVFCSSLRVFSLRGHPVGSVDRPAVWAWQRKQGFPSPYFVFAIVIFVVAVVAVVSKWLSPSLGEASRALALGRARRHDACVSRAMDAWRLVSSILLTTIFDGIFPECLGRAHLLLLCTSRGGEVMLP